MRSGYCTASFSLSSYVRHAYAVALALLLGLCGAVVLQCSAAPKKTWAFRQAADTAQNIFIKTIVSKSKVYVGEAFTVEYLLYNAVDVIDPQKPVKIKIKDSYQEEYPEEKETRQVFVNGKPYRVIGLKKMLVVANGTGNLTIPPISKELKVTVAPSPDDFFGTERSVLKRYASAAAHVEVLPLPAESNRVPFSGAIGQFKLDDTFTRQKNAHLITVQIKVTGTGNFKFDISPPPLPPGVNLFDSNLAGTHKLMLDGAKTENVLSFSLATNYRGNYVIPPATFKYFDPRTSKYVVLSTRPFKWHVPDGPTLPEAILIRNGSGSTSFLYIVTNNESAGASAILYGTLLGLSALLFFMAMLNNKRKEARANNPAAYNYKNAERNMLKALKKLKAPNPDNDTFSKEITAAFIKYLDDKTCANYSDLRMASSGVALQPIFPETIQQQIDAFLASQYTTRFSRQALAMADKAEVTRALMEIIKQIKADKHV